MRRFQSTLPTLKSAYSSPEGRTGRVWVGPLFSLAIAAATFFVAYDGGGYALTSRDSVAVLLLWSLAVGIGFGFWPRRRIPRPTLVVGGLLAAFGLWTGISIAWSSSAERSFNEANRVFLYLALFLVVVSSTARRGAGQRWIRGLGAGIAAVGIFALSSRLFPDVFEGTSAISLAQLFPSTESRLNYPVGYWNGLATLLALGVPLLLYTATTEPRALVRGLALAPLPGLAAALYLTSSRGGVAVAVLAAAAFVVLTSRRWLALVALVVAAAASVGAVEAIAVRDALVASPLSPGAASEGHGAALLVALACLATGSTYGLLSLLRLPLGRAARPLGLALAGAAVVAAVVGLVAAHPRTRIENFKATPGDTDLTTIQSHLASGSGNGRWQLWEASVDQFRAHPLVGDGAGTYQAWWAEHGSLPLFVRDGHSLFLETLGELGLIGLVLLAAALGIGLAAGVLRTFRSSGDGQAACAALTAALLAYLVEAGIDWMWETTVVTLVAVACLGLLVGPATLPVEVAAAPTRRSRRGLVLAARASAAVLAIGLVVAQGIPLIAETQIGRSQDAVRRGDADAAIKDAAAAERTQPWASSPHLQRALVEEVAADLPAARTAIHDALARDGSDWQLWLVDARIETKLENFDEAETSLRRAFALNPRSPSLAGLLGSGT